MKTKTRTSSGILVAIWLAHASWRDFLSGFLDWSRATPNWSLRIVDPTDVPTILTESSVNGLVIGDIDESVASHLIRSHVPTVVVGSQSTTITSRHRNIVFLHNDDEDIGREGVREVRRQLRATKQPIRTIAANCGWTNVNHLENAFKRRFGISMRDSRNE